MRPKRTMDKKDWGTPVQLFNELDYEFHFDLDACASDHNHKCKPYFTVKDDALGQDWTEYKSVFMNPPYGKSIGIWLKKAYETAREGNTTVVCLVPANTDTAWWHDIAAKGEVRFLRGRVKFQGADSNAPFPSAVIVFNRKQREEA